MVEYSIVLQILKKSLVFCIPNPISASYLKLDSIFSKNVFITQLNHLIFLQVLGVTSCF